MIRLIARCNAIFARRSWSIKCLSWASSISRSARSFARSAERARDIDISRAERAKLRAEREIEEAQDKHLIDQERRAKIALQRAINRINVGNKL